MSLKDHNGNPAHRVGVLLLHGLCGTPAEMRFVANGLSRAGYLVHTPTLAGHGGTLDELKASTWKEWYASAEAALDEISKTCSTVIVGGLSTGAVLALLLAARNKDKVHGLALYSTTFWLSGRQVPWYMPLFRLVPNKYLANLFRLPVPLHVAIKDQRIRDFIRSTISRDGAQQPMVTPGGAGLERWQLVKRVMAVVDGITQPTLIIHARDDEYAGIDNATFLQSKLAGTVDMTVLDDCYHMVTVDRQRHVVVERSVAFIGRVVGEIRDSASRVKTLNIAGSFGSSAA